jgi:hypothetical protein
VSTEKKIKKKHFKLIGNGNDTKNSGLTTAMFGKIILKLEYFTYYLF